MTSKKAYHFETLILGIVVAFVTTTGHATESSEVAPSCPHGYDSVPSVRLNVSNELLEGKLQKILEAQQDSIAESLSKLRFKDWYLLKDEIENCQDSLDDKAFFFDSEKKCLYTASYLSASKNPEMAIPLADLKQSIPVYFRFNDMALDNVSIENVQVDCQDAGQINACQVKAEVPSLSISSNIEMRHKDHSRYYGTLSPDRIDIKGDRPNEISFLVAIEPHESNDETFQIIRNSLELNVPSNNISLQATKDDESESLVADGILKDLVYRYKQKEDPAFPRKKDHSNLSEEELFNKQIQYIAKTKYDNNLKKLMREELDPLISGMSNQWALDSLARSLIGDGFQKSLRSSSRDLVNKIEPALDHVIGRAIENHAPNAPAVGKPFQLDLPLLSANDYLNYGKQAQQYSRYVLDVEENLEEIENADSARSLAFRSRSLKHKISKFKSFIEAAKKSSNPDLLAILSDMKTRIHVSKSILFNKAEEVGAVKKRREGGKYSVREDEWRKWRIAYKELKELDEDLDHASQQLQERIDGPSKSIILQLNGTGNKSADSQELLFNMCSPGFQAKERANPFVGPANETCSEKKDFAIELDIEAVNEFLKLMHDDGAFQLCTSKSKEKFCEQISLGSRQYIELGNAPQIKQDDMGNYFLDIPEIERDGTFLGIKPIVGKIANSDVSSCRIYLNHHVASTEDLIQKKNVDCDAEVLKSLSWEHLLAFAAPAQTAILAIAGKTVLHGALQQGVLDSEAIKEQFANIINSQMSDAILGLRTKEMVVKNGKITLVGDYIGEKSPEEVKEEDIKPYTFNRRELRCFNRSQLRAQESRARN